MSRAADGLADLYQEVILDHHKRPRNRGRLPAPARHAQGYNPLCGDRIEVWVTVDGDQLADIRFEGAGCAIATASASLMTEAVKGKQLAEVEGLSAGFHRLVAGDGEGAPSLGKLAVFAGVREFPVRVKCATLAWHTLRAAFAGEVEKVSTE